MKSSMLNHALDAHVIGTVDQFDMFATNFNKFNEFYLWEMTPMLLPAGITVLLHVNFTIFNPETGITRIRGIPKTNAPFHMGG
jgi:hypothetical protein